MRRPITLRNHIPKKIIYFFLTGGAYAPYATCMVTPLGPIYHRRQAGTERSWRYWLCGSVLWRWCGDWRGHEATLVVRKLSAEALPRLQCTVRRWRSNEVGRVGKVHENRECSPLPEFRDISSLWFSNLVTFFRCFEKKRKNLLQDKVCVCVSYTANVYR